MSQYYNNFFTILKSPHPWRIPLSGGVESTALILFSLFEREMSKVVCVIDISTMEINKLTTVLCSYCTCCSISTSVYMNSPFPRRCYSSPISHTKDSPKFCLSTLCT